MKRVGFIGFGNMGSALARGIVSKGITSKENICVYDKLSSKLDEARSLGFIVKDREIDVFNSSDIVFLAVKPKDLESSLEGVSNAIRDSHETYRRSLKDKVLVSILAGVRIEKIVKVLGFEMPIVRVMPNTPALVGEGAYGIFFPEGVSEEYRKIVVSIFDSLGRGIVVENEELMDVITGLSGSGPAYVFVVIQALADGGVRMGLSRKDAMLLASQTVLGSAKMVIENIGKIHPEELKDMVMSPAGTTAEGLKVLEENRIRFAFIKAVGEATKKSRELSK
ncbi:MAG: pyrroline-5-carboxylate reductase [Spirochaetia bacterium]|nr:pyrroline-5-carboxylate reductase [Spirochaetota bacterium]MCX8096530.1 pyrroline-5-carboxylate reductase [Spirochaetota bacterium]MDW8112688.1 pyrroline-5-carboxylate reductase [Spirochaetia bacterium]